jgi:hypothetical protein
VVLEGEAAERCAGGAWVKVEAAFRGPCLACLVKICLWSDPAAEVVDSLWATFSLNSCLISVRSTDRVSGGGATFIPLYHPGALLPLFDVVDPLVENLRFKI